jgi:hypothetical protein
MKVLLKQLRACERERRRADRQKMRLEKGNKQLNFRTYSYLFA